MRPSDASIEALSRSGYLLFHVYREGWDSRDDGIHLGSRVAHDAEEACHMLGVRGPGEDLTLTVVSAELDQLFVDARKGE